MWNCGGFLMESFHWCVWEVRKDKILPLAGQRGTMRVLRWFGASHQARRGTLRGGCKLGDWFRKAGCATQAARLAVQCVIDSHNSFAPEDGSEARHTSGVLDFCGRKRYPRSSPELRSSILHAPMPLIGCQRIGAEIWNYS